MTGLYYSEKFLLHETGSGHPESPARLEAIVSTLQKAGYWEPYVVETTQPASVDQISRVHQPAYIQHVAEACAQGPTSLESDTTVSRESFHAASIAVQAALAATDAVMSGERRNALCLLRPPGHHAEYDTAMGFCLFNNIALAAKHLLENHGLERVLILDWDVHHGNGTQSAFYENPQVFFVSLHQWPLYPGTGHPEEIGAGKGENFTRNIIFTPGASSEIYLDTFRSEIEKIFTSYAPEFVLISAGFDAHKYDPLAQLNLVEKSYEIMTRFVLELAAESAHGRVVSCLEGGYHLQALADSVLAHLDCLINAR